MGLFKELYSEDEVIIPIIHRGIVEAVDDPDKAGRVKVRLFGIHTDDKKKLKTEHLPWAMPAAPITQATGGLRNMGVSAIPNVGSHVFCFFEAGNHHTPVYFSAAPAIEDCKNYAEYKSGGARYPKDKPGDSEKSIHEYNVGNYDYDNAYDDKTKWDQKTPEFETGGPGDSQNNKDEENDHAVSDLHCTMRQNAECEGNKTNPPHLPAKMYSGKDPSSKTGEWAEPYPYFPEEFFITKIETAFGGRAYHDSTNYNGWHDTMISTELKREHEEQELDEWYERKWGWNDDAPEDKIHDHKWEGGKDSWKPKYPMLSTEMSPFGFHEVRENLRERISYIHPSKYFHEIVQLDATRKRLDFYNELSAKKVYERQRTIKSFDRKPCDYEDVAYDVNTDIEEKQVPGKDKNEITYDDNKGSARQQKLLRFEERKHVPGRVKEVVEDHIYRHYMNKINETISHDRNIRIREGNDNLEIAVGDKNTRVHVGSINNHIDKGSINMTTSNGWMHQHVKRGHHFVEIGSTRVPAPNVGFKWSNTPKPEEPHFPNHEGAGGPKGPQGPGYKKETNGKCEKDLGDGSQYILIHDGNQRFQLFNGNFKRIAHSGQSEEGRANEYLTLQGMASDNANVKHELISKKGDKSANYTLLLKGSGSGDSANFTLSCEGNGPDTSGNATINVSSYLRFNVKKDMRVDVEKDRLVNVEGLCKTEATGGRVKIAPNHEIIGPVIIDGNLTVLGNVDCTDLINRFSDSILHSTEILPIH